MPAADTAPELTALELLDIIKRYDDLTVPEFVARIAEDPIRLLAKLEQLTSIGLVEMDPVALSEIKGFVSDIDRRMANASLPNKRAELLKQTTRDATRTRQATLKATPKALSL
jgi:hypothetical protein